MYTVIKNQCQIFFDAHGVSTANFEESKKAFCLEISSNFAVRQLQRLIVFEKYLKNL